MSHDLILVGSSFASTFFLRKYLLYAHPNARVLVLERGSMIPYATRLEQTRKKPRNKVHFVTGGDTDKTYYNSTPSKTWLFDPSFGGSSNSWTGCTPRLMPSDFKLRTRYNVGHDWPLTYEDLEPFYCEAEHLMSISGPERTPYPMSQRYPQPAHSLSTVDRIMQKAYGDLYIGQPTARSSLALNRSKCCTSAVCNICPTNAKFTIENGLMSVYDDPRVEVYTEAQVIALYATNGIIRSVTFTKDGREQTVSADVVALGANPIFNAHILLNSGDSSPALGRHLSEQVGYTAFIYLDGLDNIGGSSYITANGYMLYETVDRSQQAACMIENHNGFLLRHEYGRWRQLAMMKFIFEDIPQSGNCVTLSKEKHMPVVTFNGHSQYVTRGFNYLKANMEKLLSPLPVERVVLEENNVVTEGHILGTTRMTSSPQDGVVDRNLIHHRYRNLFVLGASTFPTISPANPTLTLSALSLWAGHNAFSNNLSV
jgi:choline dehydrogenase-like flavoprotein